MEPADAVLRFLHSIGRESEARYYLRLFRAEPRHGFAAIAVDAATVAEAADAVALDLRFLRALELIPVVVLGLHDPQRVVANAAHLRRELEHAQVPSTVLDSQTTPERVIHAITTGTLPVVRLQGTGPEPRLQRLADLLCGLGTRKLIFLRREGGLRHQGKTLSIIDLESEHEAMLQESSTSATERQLLDQARRLTGELVPHKLMIAVTSPINVLHELFTVRGAGTLLRRGSVIHAFEGLEAVDAARLRELLASSFGKAPDEAFFERPLSRAYIEESYRGAALVRDTPLGGYLTKFAVTREAQGEGVGRDLWAALAKDHRTLLWRARPDNPIRPWYERQCDGLFRTGEWTVYFRGLAPEQASEAVRFVLQQPVDF